MTDMSGLSATVETMIFDRLTEADLPGPVADMIVAALLGDDDLNAVLGPQSWQRPSALQATTADAVPRFFLRSVTVEGFRGIGAEADASRAARSWADPGGGSQWLGKVEFCGGC